MLQVFLVKADNLGVKMKTSNFSTKKGDMLYMKMVEGKSYINMIRYNMAPDLPLFKGGEYDFYLANNGTLLDRNVRVAGKWIDINDVINQGLLEDISIQVNRTVQLKSLTGK